MNFNIFYIRGSLIPLITLIFLLSANIFGQERSNEEIKKQINRYKEDDRGTYKSILWFCDDGTTRAPKDPCPDSIGGIQHATYKDDVIKLWKSNHLFLGQILAYTEKEEFWDAVNDHSRLKQYQLGRYLARVDDGWVNKRGQYYRGAVQIEDEEEWSAQLYKWLLSRDKWIEKNYFLIMQSLKDLPRSGDENLAQTMRAQSKILSEQVPKFMNLRVKIHNNPEPADIQKTEQFRVDNKATLSPSAVVKLDELIATLNGFHSPFDANDLLKTIKGIREEAPLIKALEERAVKLSETTDPDEITRESAWMLLEIRKQITSIKRPSNRLALLDIADKLETITFRNSNEWNPGTLSEQLKKLYTLSMAAAGTGAIELWEWDRTEPLLKVPNTRSITLGALSKKLETARGTVEWSSATVRANYQKTVDKYTSFEPKAYGFIDDRIRSSVALRLGETVSELGSYFAKESSLTNKILSLKTTSGVRGLNPGYAMGKLVVVTGNPDQYEVSSENIYVFERAPADLKPVAGIATVSEGNLVSHVQLLARNLGIPNAVVSDDNLSELLSYNNNEVFYAVSNRGSVIMKLASEMTAEEKALFAKKVRKEERISVPMDEVKLDQERIVNLRELDADDSGKLCGPKAANLGELKLMFPENVVEGFVIPFGIFRSHMEQEMPGQDMSYWKFLNETFTIAEQKRKMGAAEAEVEEYQLSRLNKLRESIKNMSLKAELIKEIDSSFRNIFGKPIGSVPVFLRSDTNMEDLKEFTGAGLNLTLFNVADREQILQGIKDVWASPYTERSFKWRQKYLLNPENVFPSILVIPTVDVDYSGVLITKGISTGDDQDLTVAFSRGAGGAVDGQAAESYLLRSDGSEMLLSPAREPYYNGLPKTGGTIKKSATFENPILNKNDLSAIRSLAKTIAEKMSEKPGEEPVSAYDVELGFKDGNLWLFQIRPFVENKKALGSEYLQSISPKVNSEQEIMLNTPI